MLIDTAVAKPATKNIGLIEALSRVLDLPYKWVFKEAQTKLNETRMFLNGALVYIVSISQDHGVMYKFLISPTKDYAPLLMQASDVSSLEVFLPQSGIYRTTSGQVVMLTKNPIRQWKRSYNNGIYNYTCLVGDTDLYPEELIIDSRTDIWVSPKNHILYYDIIIGEVVGKTIFCTNKLYEQELIDWIKYGQAAKVFSDFQLQTSK